VVRSYVYVGDVLDLSLRLALDGATPSPCLFDTRGEVDVEMADLVKQIEAVLLPHARSTPRQADRTLSGSVYLGKAEPMGQFCRDYELSRVDLAEQIRMTAEDIAARHGG